MAKQAIGIGTVANDGTGDTLRDAFDKVNDNFNELYDRLIDWDMSTNTFPTGGSKGQDYYGTELSTRTTLTDTAGNLLPSKVLAKALIDNPTTNADFAFINVIF